MTGSASSSRPAASTLRLTLRGLVVEAGSDWCGTLGCDPEELGARDVRGLLDPESAEALLTRIELVVRGVDPPTPLDLTVLLPGAHQVVARVRTVPVLDARGRAAAVDLLLESLPAGRRLSPGEVHSLWRQRRLSLDAQPILDATTLVPVRHELLVRMVSYDEQVFGPDRFLPVMAQLGLSADLDRWVVAEALRILGRDAVAALEVNLSEETVRDPDGLIAFLAVELDGSGIDPARLTLSVDCAIARADPAAAVRCLTSLRDLGCRTALDHVGETAEDLDLIEAMPCDLVKIDGPGALDLDDRHPFLLASIIDLAHRRGREAVAGRLDGAPVLERRRRQGVDAVQGYHVAFPASARQALGRTR